MTYTVIARCPRTRQFGIGIATYSIGVGLYCNGLRGGVGVTISQAFVNQGNNTLALNLLEQGFTPSSVVDQLAANDPDAEYRQVGVVDREGRAVAYSGPRTRAYSGHRIGDGFVAMGNVLAGPHVVDAIGDAFEAHHDKPLELRLLRAIEAGRDSGGQVGNDGHLTERSAALVVYGDHNYAEFDLRIDLHDHAVDELRRSFEAYQPYRAYYRDRGLNPKDAVAQDVFMAGLVPTAAVR